MNSLTGPVMLEDGALTLGAACTLGATCTNVTVVSGTLALQQAGALDPLTVLTLSKEQGARLRLDASVTVNYLVVDGRRWYADTYGATGSGAHVIDDTLFSGTGVLTVRRGSRGTTLRLQ